jgi:NDP-sugar pyrophosphorylase family protein
MDCIILAAGFGTRLRRQARSTELEGIIGSVPKPLLPLNGDCIVGHLLRFLKGRASVGRVFVVTNGAHCHRFLEWREGLDRDLRRDVEVICDPAKNEDQRLGSLGDLNWALMNGVGMKGPIMVLAGDCLLMGDDPGRWITEFQRKGASTLLVQRCHQREISKRSGCVYVGAGSQVLAFEEKPLRPKWPWAALPVHIYTKDVMEMLPVYLGVGGDADSMGGWIPWLLKRGVMIAAVEFKGVRIDCGSLEGYLKARAMAVGA